MTGVVSLGPVVMDTLQPAADAPAGPGFATLIAAFATPAAAALSPPASGAAPVGDGGATASGDEAVAGDLDDIDTVPGSPSILQPLPPLPPPTGPAAPGSTAAGSHVVAACSAADVPSGHEPRPVSPPAAPRSRVPTPEEPLLAARPDALRPLPGGAPALDVVNRPAKRITAPPAVQIAGMTAVPAGPERPSVTAGVAALVLLAPTVGAEPSALSVPVATATATAVLPVAVPANPAAPVALALPATPNSTLSPAPLPVLPNQPRIEPVPASVARDQRRIVAPLRETGGDPMPLAGAAAQPATLAAATPAAASGVPSRTQGSEPAPPTAGQVAEQAPGSFAVATDRLGPVQVMLDARDARVSVQLAADTPAAGQLLAAHPSRLADAVAAGGQRLDALAVDVRSGGGQQQGRQSPQPRPEPLSIPRPASAPRAASADRFA